MSDRYLYVSIIIAIVILIMLFWILYLILKSPFEYPYFIYYFNVSGKRKPKKEDLLDDFLNKGKFNLIQLHNGKVQCWKEECQKKIAKSLLKNLRMRQYQKCIDDSNTFVFVLTRQQTRYRQSNYVKSSYKVSVVDNQFLCSYIYLKNRYEMLEEIHFECTLSEYNSKNQRKLMTKELRKRIMLRDNNTCQICGKYMPDEVGLHIDHIIPVSKGGRTVPSNLQVLCSKCNGHKSDAILQYDELE